MKIAGIVIFLIVMFIIYRAAKKRDAEERHYEIRQKVKYSKVNVKESTTTN